MITITLENEQSDAPIDEARWGALATAVIDELKLGANVELSLTFVDKAVITDLNQRFLSHEGPTDVLSFPIEDDDVLSDPTHADSTMPLLLGDIVICPAVAKAQAPDHESTYEDELALLIVHGILHLIGMDHEIDVEAEAMEAWEQELLSHHHVANTQ